MTELLRNPDVVIALISTVGGVVIAFFAIFKGGDLLGVLQQRKIYRLRGELRHSCPHVKFSVAGEQLQCTPLFTTTVGIIHYYCQLCGCKVNEHETEKLISYWRTADHEDIKKAIEDLGKAHKLRRKLDSLGNWAAE